ncbi:hypothetical protein M422DRAFT_30567 [Sphaerobolus stellatus SS14]|uniref:Uncharacterized protein n=1 Tax=Sphaerobolus stellatus (strain SS14) TaxID=990650 RepID=A0A0C9ULU1_SPHS4|nr:hypothetical protein M422DRAFT_30567 [Sphaerobolus stellatus SS14]
MFSRSRHHSGTQHIGASAPSAAYGPAVRGPYKRWVPNAEMRLSESEEEPPKPSSSRPRVSQPVQQPDLYPTSALPSRTSAQYQQHAQKLPPSSHRSRPDPIPIPNGYSSESTIHAPTTHHKSGFASFFKSHSKDPKESRDRKDPKSHATSARAPVPATPAKQPRTTTAYATAPTPNIPSSEDPTPRSSIDSVRDGNMSAPAQYHETRRSTTIWNSYVDPKMYARKDVPPVSSRDRKLREKEDLIARIPESTGRAKDYERVLLQTTKPDDTSSTRRTVSSKTQDSHTRQPQSSRHQKPPDLPEPTPRLTRSNTRTESQPRAQPPEPPSKHTTSTTQKVSAAAIPMSKATQSRTTASNPWPFNQGPEPLHKSQAPVAQPSQAPSSYWRNGLSRLQTTSKTVPALPLSTSVPTASMRRDDDTLRPPKATPPKVNPYADKALDTPHPDKAHLRDDRERDEPTVIAMTPAAGRTSAGVATSSSRAAAMPIPTLRTTRDTNVYGYGYRAGSTANLHGANGATNGTTTSRHYEPTPETVQAYARVHPTTITTNTTTTSTSTRQRLNSVSKAQAQLPTPPNSAENVNGTSSFARGTNANANTTSHDTTISMADPAPTSHLPPPTPYPHARARLDSTASQMLAATATAANTNTNAGRYTRDVQVDKPLPVPQTQESRPVANTNTNNLFGSSTQHAQSVWLPPQQRSREGAYGYGYDSSSDNNNTTTAANTTANANTTAPNAATALNNISTASAAASLNNVSRNGRLVSSASQAAAAQAAAVQPAGTWTTPSADPHANGAIRTSHQSSKTPTPPEPYNARPAANGTHSRETSGNASGNHSSDDALTPKPPVKANLAEDMNAFASKAAAFSSSGTKNGSGQGQSGRGTPQDNHDSDVNITIPAVTTRVPISGHPSTPAPIRPALRPTPPPLSIASTSLETDSLLTPSSLNSPPMDMHLFPSNSAVTMTPATPGNSTATEKEKKSKPGFFDFFKSKPSTPAPTSNTTNLNGAYDVWLPPSMQNGRERERMPKDVGLGKLNARMNAAALASGMGGGSAPIAIPGVGAKSPKFLSPLKLFSRRHRTVSNASLDALDGTTTNTLMNSPASSLRASTPGAPPSPIIRDPFLATEEWRNREAEMSRERKRAHRPGVTFDCPDELAPVEAAVRPKLMRVQRSSTAFIQGEEEDEEIWAT